MDLLLGLAAIILLAFGTVVALAVGMWLGSLVIIAIERPLVAVIRLLFGGLPHS